jgi:hypothetical protein
MGADSMMDRHAGDLSAMAFINKLRDDRVCGKIAA